jgi:hypothetical protein
VCVVGDPIVERWVYVASSPARLVYDLAALVPITTGIGGFGLVLFWVARRRRSG